MKDRVSSLSSSYVSIFHHFFDFLCPIPLNRPNVPRGVFDFAVDPPFWAPRESPWAPGRRAPFPIPRAPTGMSESVLSIPLLFGSYSGSDEVAIAEVDIPFLSNSRSLWDLRWDLLDRSWTLLNFSSRSAHRMTLSSRDLSRPDRS